MRLSYRSAVRAALIVLGLPGLLLVLGLFGLGVVYAFLNARLTATEIYRDSLATAEASPEVQSALGSNIHAEWPVIGYNLRAEHSEFAQWSVKLRGSSGKAHLYGVANKINGEWEYSRLIAVLDAGSKSFDLTSVPRVAGLPHVAAQKVYLIPAGLAGSESLNWAPAYYKAKFGIDVEVLPTAALQPSLVDPLRHQLDASKFLDFVKRTHPELARDPFAILIGVTSRDMFIPDFDWDYAENWRTGGRFAIVSSARLRPPSLLDEWNPEWLNSRLQKILTKNIVMLYYSLPLSSDDTSLLSGGMLSGTAIDLMGTQVTGAEGAWSSFFNTGDPGFTVYDVPGKPALWRTEFLNEPVRNTDAQIFSTDLGLRLFVQRKMDFILDGDDPFEFTRVYTANADRSRSFGVGASNNLDLFLAGQMGAYVELCFPDGTRIRFVPAPSAAGHTNTYRQTGGSTGPFRNTTAEFDGKVWRVKRNDDWTLYFPYHPEWLGQYVTVLGSFAAPDGLEYKIERDNVGAALSITTPSGKWLHFENDAQHRISRIQSSLGRTVQYEYDPGGRLIRARDSDGHMDAYTYDEKNQMITARHETGPAVLTNAFSNDGYITGQTLVDGGKIEFSYLRGPRNIIEQSRVTDPSGMLTSFFFAGGGYTQTLPHFGGH
jgi:YD repeat-containing protein